ncbi:hypothetical protein BH18ACT5_BH18ACT5_11360 [soil metagenome]
MAHEFEVLSYRPMLHNHPVLEAKNVDIGAGDQADATDIDKSIAQTLEEWERKIRAEVTQELTGKDALGRVIDPETVG